MAYFFFETSELKTSHNNLNFKVFTNTTQILKEKEYGLARNRWQRRQFGMFVVLTSTSINPCVNCKVANSRSDLCRMPLGTIILTNVRLTTERQNGLCVQNYRPLVTDR